MRNALILHGTDGHPDKHWFQWLAEALRQRGYDVTVPALPGSDHPNLDKYWAFLRGYDFNPETIIVGHSSGATTALALLHKLPPRSHVRLVVSVAGFYRDDGFNCEALFTEAYNWEKIREAAGKIVLVWSPDDQIVVEEQTKVLSERLGVEPTLIPGGGHFSTHYGGPRFHEFPELLDIIDANISSVAQLPEGLQNEV
jgi:predicted alpha/beta hydrolase family esterase